MTEECSGEQQYDATFVPSITSAETDDAGATGLEGGVSATVGVPMPVLRVEQLKEEGCSSNYTSEEESDTEILNRLGEFVPPSDELASKIVAQIEFYFSDNNIVKDAFLLKHVRRNKHGYVNLKLITSFKKMKALTKDFRVVAHSVRELSDKLEVNEDGNKVRRKAVLPEYDETTPSRTVVVSNLPSESPSIESIADLFKDCGEIALIRILRPGKPLPPDVKKQLSKHPETGSTTVALVEFEKHEAAAKACTKVAPDSSRSDWRMGLRVAPLVLSSSASLAAGRQKKKSHEGSEKAQHLSRGKQGGSALPNTEVSIKPASSDGNLADGFSSGSEGDFGPRSRGSSFGSEPSRSRGNSLGTRPSPLAAASPGTQRRRNLHGTSPLAAGGACAEEKRISPRPSPGGSPEARRRHSSGASAGSSDAAGELAATPQWMQRRMAPGREISPLAKLNSPSNGGGGSPSAARKMAKEDILIRLPRGPDGTRGFHRCVTTTASNCSSTSEASVASS